MIFQVLCGSLSERKRKRLSRQRGISVVRACVYVRVAAAAAAAAAVKLGTARGDEVEGALEFNGICFDKPF
jgi:hypothetical protein